MAISLFLCTLEHLAEMTTIELHSTKLPMTSLQKDREQISIRVYSGMARTTTDLKEAFREEIRAIFWSVCKNVMESFVLRLNKCTELNGGHLEQML